MRFVTAIFLIAISLACVSGGAYLLYESEKAYILRFIPEDFYHLKKRQSEVSFSLYSADYTSLYKKYYVRSRELYPEEKTPLLLDMADVLNNEIDAVHTDLTAGDKVVCKVFEINPENIQGYIANNYADKFVDSAPLDKYRKKILRWAAADRITKFFGSSGLRDMYLNNSYMGRRTFGIAAAAETYFDKPFKQLTLSEKAFLASLIKDPERLDPEFHYPVADKRRRLVLYHLYKNSKISKPQYTGAVSSKLTINAPHEHLVEKEYVEQVLSELVNIKMPVSGSYNIYTHLDLKKTRLARQAVQNALKDKDPALQAGFVLLNYETGGVEVLIGSKNSGSLRRASKMRRQIGSTFKPIVFLTALENGMRPSDIMYDKPYRFRNGRRYYTPANYDDYFMGRIPLRYALVYSLNNATIKLAQKTGFRKVRDTARSLGMDGTLNLYLAMPLGIYSLTPLNLAQVYATIASYGVKKHTGVISKVVDKNGRVLNLGFEKDRRVADEASAYQVIYMMKDVVRKGTARASGIFYGTAAKTGTTDDYKDAWTVAVFPPYVAAVWVGYDNFASMGEDGTGGSMAAPVIAEFQRLYYGKEFNVSFQVPENVTFRHVNSYSGEVTGPLCRGRKTYLEAFKKSDIPPVCGEDKSRLAASNR